MDHEESSLVGQVGQILVVENGEIFWRDPIPEEIEQGRVGQVSWSHDYVYGFRFLQELS